MNTLLCLNLTNVLLSAVSGFIGSIGVFKKAFPEQENYQQETLVKTILKTTYGAHDATEDIESLVMLLMQTKFSGSDLLSFSFPSLARGVATLGSSRHVPTHNFHKILRKICIK